VAKIFRIGRLISFSVLAKVSAGASAGILAALALHPGSRPLVIDGLRPAPPALADQGGLTPALPPLPDPSNIDAASFWLSAYVIDRERGITLELDQLLLLTEIAQAGRAAEPRNRFWPQVEALAMHDMGRIRKRDEALSAAARAPEFKLSTGSWLAPLKSRLRRWSGRSFSWHDEAAASGPEAQLARAFLRMSEGASPSEKKRRLQVASAVSPEARSLAGVPFPGDFPFRSSWPVWRLASFLSQALASSFLIVLVFARGASRWSPGALWLLCLALTSLLALLLPSPFPALGFGAVASSYLASPLWSGAEPSALRTKTWALLTAGAAILPLSSLVKGDGVFSYLPSTLLTAPTLWTYGIIVAFGIAGVLVKSRMTPEEADAAEARVLPGAIWVMCIALLFSAASAVALVALEHNSRMGLGS
jgi:hypothetical protein